MNRKVIITVLLVVLAFTMVQAYSFGKNKVQREHLQWSKIETIHFDIYFAKGNEDFGKAAALMAEETYFYLKDHFKTPLINRIPIILYKSKKDFHVTHIISPLLGEGVGGFTESLRNRVVVPFDGTYRGLERTLVHELVHAYENELNRSFGRLFDISSSLPFWFSEGLPEFFAVGGEDVYNNMFIIDLLMNEGIPRLERTYGYYAYRLGESFLIFIEAEYGSDKVMELFYALRISGTTDAAFRKVFGMNFEEMQKRWKNFLRKEYFADVIEYDIPYEVYNRRTNHRDDSSNRNFAPRYSPNGEHYLYFSDKNLRTSIMRGSTFGVYPDRLILKGETKGKFEEFHFERNNITWFPDNQHFAFVAKTSTGDRIYKMDSQSGKVVETYEFDRFDAVYEIDLNRDGSKIAFSGQKNMQADLYVYDIDSGEITQLTDDSYLIAYPRWSPDGTKIAFHSERFANFDSAREYVFGSLSKDVFYYDFEENSIYMVTNDPFNSFQPFWDSSGDYLLFVSERTVTSNFEAVKINTGDRAAVTNLLGGVFTGDLDHENESMIFSVFYEGGWNIFIKEKPLQNLEFSHYAKPERIDFEDDLYTKFDIDRYKYFGKRDIDRDKRQPAHYPDNVARVDLRDFPGLDTLFYHSEMDEKPTTVKKPEISPYRTKLSLDWLWGGMAYSSARGTHAQIMLGMSDLMGNHELAVNLGVTGELENSDFMFNYLYLARRLDYGLGGFYLNDEIVYRIRYLGSDDIDYMRERERELGLYGAVRYPFNRFWRVTFENLITRRIFYRDWWDWDEQTWIEEFVPEEIGIPSRESELMYTPQISFTHDNSVFGAVGPLEGWRGTLIFSKNFSKKQNYTIFYSDLRRYWFFAKRYSFATRITGGTILGDSSHRFRLDPYFDVRGYYNENEHGNNKVSASTELRFPFVERLSLGFPLPITLSQIRGSAFMDIGAVWDDSDFNPTSDGKLDDLKFSFGFGPRMNLGYFVLRLDITWQTDFSDVSKPGYYISLLPDF